VKHILERFSQNARDALIKSQIIARTEAHSFVSTHHLLLALTQQSESLACRVLKDLQVDTTKIGEICKRVIFKQRQEDQTQGIEDELRTVIQYAFEEAADLGSTYVGTEHLLLGIMAMDRSLAAQILINSQVDPEEIRLKIHELSGFFESPIKQGKIDTGEATLIENYGRDLNLEAALGRLDPVIGREAEIDRVIQTLSRRTKNNPILLGEAGVGKTAIVEGLAQRIYDQQVPIAMRDKRVISLNISALVAGTKFRGDFEERMVRLLQEIQQDGQIILFIDEIHTLLGAGSATGSLDAANILKPLLAKGEIQTIGATTYDEYRDYIEEDSALTRRFQPIGVEEPTLEQATKILTHLGKSYEKFHGVRYDRGALELAASLAQRYITERKLPDAAIDLIDEAASYVKISRAKTETPQSKLQHQLDHIALAKEQAIDQQEYDQAFTLRRQEQQLRQRLDKQVANTKQPSRRSLPAVRKQDIAQVLSNWLNIPTQELDQSETQNLIQLEDKLHQRIVGQDEAINLVSRSLRRSRVGLANNRRPIASFMFMGPSGVGKTETARALAEAMFGGSEALIKINMSEYMERYSVSNLIGSPAGYIGYEEGGKLTEMVRRKPYSVVLFDEIEKAHPDIFNIMLQVLEDGELVDAKGRSVDFRNTIIIFTSNLGAEFMAQKGRIGFSASGSMDELQEQVSQQPDGQIYERLMDNLKQNFRPEFLNRLSGIVVYRSLTAKQTRQIARLMIADVEERLKSRKIKLKVDPAVYQYLSQHGVSQDMGVRPMQRVIEREIEDSITDKLLDNSVQKGQVIDITIIDEAIIVKPRAIKKLEVTEDA
jgi:ATP-dependent Clp protease ATP-binding subunit ClpC